MPKDPPPMMPTSKKAAVAKGALSARPQAPPVPVAKQPAQGSAKERSLSGSLKKRLRQKTKDAAAALARKDDEVFEAAKGHKHMTKTQKKDMKRSSKRRLGHEQKHPETSTARIKMMPIATILRTMKTRREHGKILSEKLS